MSKRSVRAEHASRHGATMQTMDDRPAPAKMPPAAPGEPSRKAPKPPKPRKVEKRQRGRKG